MSGTAPSSNSLPERGSVVSLARVRGRGVSARALDTSHTGGARTVILEVRTGDGTVDMALTASEAAELMFELGFALEEAARIVSGRPPRDAA